MRTRPFVTAIGLVVLLAPVWAEDTDRTNRSTTQSASASSSQASLGQRAWGVRVGMTDGVDQVIGGAQVNLGNVARNVRLQPDVELGAGDDATTLYGTLPLYYRFGVRSRVTPYAGGGLALGYVDRDLPATSTGDDGGFELGARATGGLEWPRRSGAFFVELSLGFGDVHDARVVAAWMF